MDSEVTPRTRSRIPIVGGLVGFFRSGPDLPVMGDKDWISGILIEMGKSGKGDAVVYNFDFAFTFWIGAAILSTLLALFAWNVKPHE